MTPPALVSLLLLTIVMSSASAQGGIGNCCRKYSDKQITREHLRSYYVQSTSSCAVHAVVFTTITGQRICGDPRKMWTQTSKAFVDGKNYYLQNVTARSRRTK